jgi:two-component system phosphate regulon sensor histidine kinase PhoR
MDEQSARLLVEALPLPVVVIAASQRVLAANAPARAMFGLDLAGRHHALALRQPALQTAIAAALADGRAGQVRHVEQGESTDSVFRVTVAPAADVVVVSFEDISVAEMMGHMRRDFVANVSHELRTPLTAFTGFIETLQGRARDDAPTRDRFLDIMSREAARMNRLVSDLLHLSRVEAEERVRPTAAVDLVALLRATLATLRPMAEDAGVTLELDLAEEKLVLPADADQLTQVFSNLVENAVKYGGAGGSVTLCMVSDRLPQGPAVRVDVIDRGEGIDPVHIPRLTERFYRIDSHRSRAQGGTGLGLAIVKHIVHRHRGRMRIESAPGKGSVFSVLLPLS